MPIVEIVGQSARDADNVAANPSRLINCYRESVLQGGRTRHAIKSVAGQEQTDSTGFPIRIMGRGNNMLYAASNAQLWSLDGAGDLTSIGAIEDDVNSLIFGNYTDTTITANGKYWVYDGATVTEITGGPFTDIGSHTYVGGYTVLTERGGRRLTWSELGDATTLNPLYVQAAEQEDDNVLRVVEFQNSLLIFCERSTEIWQISGTGLTTFSIVTSNNTGLKDFHLLTKFDDMMFFVGNDNRCYLFGQGVVSTPAVETAIAQGQPTHCFYHEGEGHKFCTVRFADRPSWVFDFTQREWHERAEGAGNGPYRAVTSIKNGNAWWVGNEDGNVLRLERNNRDINGDLFRTIVTYPVYSGGKFSVDKIELVGRMGEHSLAEQIDYGLDAGDGFILDAGAGFGLDAGQEDAGERDAEISMLESGDGGQTWRGPIVRSMGKEGDYEQRMVWRMRGQFQQYSAWWRLNERADITLYADAVLETS